MKDEFNSIPVDTNDKDWVSSKISHMVKIDQFIRHFSSTPFDNNYSPEEEKYFQKNYMPRFSKLDSENTTQLKHLLAIYGWFKISEFGEQTDKDAWLLVQHADLDVKFQKRILLILMKLYPQGETNKSNYAYLYDRVKSIAKKNHNATERKDTVLD